MQTSSFIERRNILFKKWVLVNDFETYLDPSQLLWVKDGISLLTCCSLCDMEQSCRTFFYHPSLNRCLGSQSFKRGLPPDQSVRQEWKYYTKAPKCDEDYTFNKTLGFCYKIHEERRTFIEAMDVCEEEGAKPIIIRNAMETLQVQNFIIGIV
ncbi:hypothetical protein CHS0354_027719 [Potamilus streckersoni]|uniref:Apple domain-containing protein n=1 Tax=Potamilus streckersoni TaxID=2493646 RepID=A0AAE0W844_9BIVA|nr:hypothetical protein CHS0354_027719 [Potamilus streckersoni]